MAKLEKSFLKILGAKSEELPLIVLRDMVVFPKVAVPLAIRRSKSLKALDEAMHNNRMAVFTAQRSPDIDDPKKEDLFTIATVAKVRELVKQKDKTTRTLIEGVCRVRILYFTQTEPYYRVRFEALAEPTAVKTEKIEALMYGIISRFKECVNLGATVPLDVLLMVVNINDPWQLGDLITLNLDFKIEEKQEILESSGVEEKLTKVGCALDRQMKLLKMARKMQFETGKELDKMQKEVFLREQLKAIEKELGILGGRSETEELKNKIEKAGMPKETKKIALKELYRMERMPSFSPEISYIRTYLDWLIDVPWSKKNKSKVDIIKAEKILDEDHYGLKKPKERISEYLAVQKLVGRVKGPILCFTGPPGTGKTSIGKSVSRALDRKFVKMSLGGIRDEAEIRGHRRTYVGALPGRIIQGIKTAGTNNPVFMLDEIDKLGSDFRGDPSSALLEALDPEQNYAFSDHYLEVPFDLSDVIFITTANVLDTIPPALRDRLEVIEFAGYTEEEKYHIAKDYLVSKQLKANGLDKKNIDFSEPGLRTIIREYTQEAGVRNLEREIAAVCRKIAKKVSKGEEKISKINIDAVHEYLGPPKYFITMAEKQDEVGVVTGLAWTMAGGEILHIEATQMPGRGNLILTGHLGKVMKESAQAAFSYAKVQAKKIKKIKDYKNLDFHIHVPSGAIPKDGPSAGVAMAVALVSVLTGKKVKRTIGMTGEMTLRGKVLEIGGVKEKILAAYRAELKTVIMPKRNEKDMEDVPEEVKKKMKFVFAEHIDEVLKIVLNK